MQRGAALISLLLIAASNAATLVVVDNADVTGNLSQFVDYSSILEEDKMFTLEKLTTDPENNSSWETEEEEEHTTPAGGGEEAAEESRRPRIVPQSTATAATLGQFPFYVLLTVVTRRGTTIKCGGAIISDSWVLTAAQCVYSATTITVDAGLIDTTATAEQSTTGVAHVYPQFKQNYIMHDIALVMLLKPFALTANVYPIRLVKKDYHGNELNLATVRTMGFGPATNAATAIGTALNFVDLMQLSKAACAQQTAATFVSYPHTTSCLSSASGTSGFCLGDTGGPVVFTFVNELTISLLGVNSIFQGCPSTYPMAYTRVGPYLKWIRTKVPKLL